MNIYSFKNKNQIPPNLIFSNMISEPSQSLSADSYINNPLLRSIKRDEIPKTDFSILPYLNYFQSDSQQENVPINSNIEMWSTKMLKELKSELILLCAQTDKLEEAINAKVKNIENDAFESIKNEELNQSLGFNQLCFHPDQFNSYQAERMHYDNIYKSIITENTEKKKKNKNICKKIDIKERTKEEKQQYIQQNQDNIWLNTDKFLKPIEDFTKINKILLPSKKITIDLNHIPNGQHFSMKLLNNIRGDIKSKLIIPKSFNFQNTSSTALHKRLISALLPINETKNDLSLSFKENEPSFANNIEIDSFYKYGTPTSYGQGMSHYQNLCIGERIELELESLQMKNTKQDAIMMDSPIIKQLSILSNSQERILSNVNHMKSMIVNSLNKNMPIFRERVRLKEKWTMSLESYLKHKEQKQSKAKSKK